jgi:hypothetical protein
MVRDPKSSPARARLFWVPAALALLIPPALLSLALLLHYTGSHSTAPPVMNLVFFSSFICIFISLILVLIALVLLVFSVVEFQHIRLGAELALLGFVTNFFVFSFVLYKFYRPH